MNKIFISIATIALIMESTAQPQPLEAEYILTFQEWERKVPSFFFHDFKVGPDGAVYLAVETGIYKFNQENNAFTLIPNTADMITFNMNPNAIRPLNNGKAVFESGEQLKLISGDSIDTLPIFFDSREDPIENISSAFNKLVGHDLDQIYFTGSYPLDEPKTLGIYTRDENGVIELYAGGGSQEIGEIGTEPVHRLDMEINGFIHDLHLFEENSIAMVWDEETPTTPDTFYKISLITPDGMVREHMSYRSEEEGRAFANNNLFFDTGPPTRDYPHTNRIMVINPNMNEPKLVTSIPGSTVRWSYMDYSKTNDTLYVLTHKVDKLELWKVPNVLKTLGNRNILKPSETSSVERWEDYE